MILCVCLDTNFLLQPFFAKLISAEDAIRVDFKRDGRMLTGMLAMAYGEGQHKIQGDLLQDLQAERLPLAAIEKYQSLMSMYAFIKLMSRIYGTPLNPPKTLPSNVIASNIEGLGVRFPSIRCSPLLTPI